MPIVFGVPANSVEEIVAAFARNGDRVRGTYRAHYRFDQSTGNPYSAPRLERPECLKDNPPEVIFPWEQVVVAAATCAGSDYPMLAAHYGIPLERVDFTVEALFDPQDEFDGLGGFHAPTDARHCYLALHLRATLASSAPRAELERLHERVVSHNMVLGALRGIPSTNELAMVPARHDALASMGAGR
jgi:OsmC-like protein